MMVAWTTTPWTLPSNLALCVHPDLDYVIAKGNIIFAFILFLDKITNIEYVVMEARLSELKNDNLEVIEKVRYNVCLSNLMLGKRKSFRRENLCAPFPIF